LGEAVLPAKPVPIWRRLDWTNVGVLLILSYISFMVAAISLDRWVIYDRLRFDGSVYPVLTLLFGPAVLVLAQRLTNRAGAATFAILLGFILAGALAFFLRGVLGYPKAASLPIMGLTGALLLDVAFMRHGRSLRALVLVAPLFVVVFYVSEFLWAWYLTRYPWWPIERALFAFPLGVAVGTASALLGAWLAERMERLGFVRRGV
jgi:hypothetical protein